MRVALITDGIWPYVLGGMQKHSYYLCKYLAQNKIYVDLFHFNSSTYDISKLDVFTDKERRYITSHIVKMPRSLRFPGHYLYNSYRHSKLIFDKIKDQLLSFDFIFTKGFAGWYLIEQKWEKKIKSPPVGVKFHGYEMFQKPPDLKTKLQHLLLLRKPVRAISQKADVVFSYGGKITDIIRSLDVDEGKIFELPSGVESSSLVSEIRPCQGKIKIVYLGRYERRKGVEELNKAIKQLVQENSELPLQFSFIGPIPKRKQINSKSVMYFGEIRNRQKLQELMREQDILICPSWSEGMPNVILEAMANGLAVVATDVGANNVLVNDKTGWLINDSQPSTISRVLKQIMATNAGEINTRKENALRLIAKDFTWEKLITDLIARLFNKTLNDASD
jgi:glycosyltransferase involved in cell wall biosynthesis